MEMMTMTNRERGSSDGRGKHNTLLGRWFKKEQSIPIVTSTLKEQMLQRGSIVSLFEDESYYLVFGVWKDNNKKWWMSPEGETGLTWPLTKSVTEKKSYRLKVRKMVGTKSTEGSLEVQYMANGRGGTLENVQDGLNVRKTYKIIKNLREVTTLHGAIDI